MTIKKINRGQAMIELTITASIMLSGLIGILSLCYWIFFKLIVAHHLYESMLCAVQHTSHYCEQQVLDTLQRYPLLKVKKVKIKSLRSRKAFRIYGELSVANSLCLTCHPILIQDSVYVPKTYY